MKPVVAISCGDPAGVGPELIERALGDADCPATVEFVRLGEVPPGTVPGRPDAAGAAAAIRALEQAVAGLRDGRFAAVVTAPVAKRRLHAAGFAFPGHTEFFADAFGVAEPTMCLTGPSLTVALVTAHLALAEVPRALSAAKIRRTVLDLADHLALRLGRLPRLAVAGLNPHAGEGGAFGCEEIELIAPAVERIGRELEPRCALSGPHSPDTVFQRAVAGEFDGVVCLYHDQGLIPLKLLDFDRAVNITLGLPVIRTSPDHGTAFDLAGSGRARHQSLLAAMQLAAELVERRQADRRGGAGGSPRGPARMPGAFRPARG